MQARTVVLDNEAVQAFMGAGHPKHRRVLARIEAVAARNLRKAGLVRLVVPTAVRVEACWDRRTPGAGAINRLIVDDKPLGSSAANVAARIRAELGISAVDGHLAVVIDSTPGPHAVLTSDVDDVRRIARHLGRDVTPVRV